MMNLRRIIAVAALVIVVLVGYVGYSFFRTPATASEPIEAIPLASTTASVDAEASATTATAASVEAEASATTASAAGAEASTAAGQTEASAAAEQSEAAGTTADMSTILAQIVPEESEARFVLGEVLNNEDVTVVGTTNQVAGELSVDADDPSATQIGTIQVNARTLATDNDFRNRAIQNRILQTETYEYITFVPTEIVGLPESGDVGQSYTFQIVGDLTIRDVTKQVTFDVTATPESESRLAGSASTKINYADWGISIPQVRQVASVDEEVRLEIDFVAAPV